MEENISCSQSITSRLQEGPGADSPVNLCMLQSSQGQIKPRDGKNAGRTGMERAQQEGASSEQERSDDDVASSLGKEV